MNFKKNNQTSILNHKIAPRESAWLRLDAKLEKHRGTATVQKYKLISIAASLIGILGVMSLIFTQKEILSNAPESAQIYSVEVFEYSTDQEMGIYEVNKLRGLKLAYNKNIGKGKNKAKI